MTRRSDVRTANAAGKEAVERETPYPIGLGAFFGVMIGTWLTQKYKLPWLESDLVSVLLIVLLAFMFRLIERRLRRAIREGKQRQ
jgi:hypothetical protein